MNFRHIVLRALLSDVKSRKRFASVRDRKSGGNIMADEATEAASSAIAAFTLSQLAFWAVLQSGLFDRQRRPPHADRDGRDHRERTYPPDRAEGPGGHGAWPAWRNATSAVTTCYRTATSHR